MALTKITSDVIAAGAVESTHIASGAISSSHLSSITTDNVSEGSTNTYFTNARARSSVSVTGGGLSYDSGTGVIQIASIPNASLANSSLTVNSNSVSLGGSVTLDTDDIGEGSTNLYFTNARAQGAISGGTGVTVSSGTISIGQDVATSSTPTFGNITTTGYIAGPATFTIDPAAVGDNTGTVVIAGNLQVDGTTTTINSTTMEVDDLNITLASGAANAAAANGAGITVDGASATLTYSSTGDSWEFNKDVIIGVNDTTPGALTIYGGATGNAEGGEIRLHTGADHDTTYDHYRIDIYEDDFRIGRAGTTDITLDSSGNFMVGGTNSRPAEFNHPKGISFRGDIGQIQASTDANIPLLLNRDTSDGTIIDFRKDGTTVGVISSQNWGIGTSSPTSFLSNATTLEISGGTGVGSELILTNDSSMSADEVVGSLIFKNTDGSGTPNHFAGLRSKAEAQYGRMYLEFYAGRSRMEGGTPDMVISPAGADAQGRVGIGTSSPDSPLHVKTTDQSIQIRNTGNANVGLEIYRDSDGAKGASIAWGNGNANLEIKNYRNDGQSGGPYANIDFFTGGTDADSPDYNPTRRMRIQQTGEVGIGTDDPEKALHIRSISNQIRLQDSTNDKKYDLNVDGNNFSIDDMSAGASRFTIKDGGNVGIGTSNPSADLHISKTSGAAVLKVDTTAAADAGIQILGYDAYVGLGDATNGLQWYVWNDGVSASSSLKFGSEALSGSAWYADASQAMVITSSGKVGIGTTSPTNAKVHIVGDSSYVGDYGYSTLVLEDSSGYAGLNLRNGNNNWLMRNAGNNNSLQIVSSSNASGPGTGTYTPRLVIMQAGNVGIGTDNPSQFLDVRGHTQIGDGGGAVLLNFNATGNAQLKFGNTEWLRHSAGGTTSIGNIAASSFQGDEAVLELYNDTGSHDPQLYMRDVSAQTATGRQFSVLEGAIYLNGTGDQIKIPFGTQTGSWRKHLIIFDFVGVMYNNSSNGYIGGGKIAMSTLSTSHGSSTIYQNYGLVSGVTHSPSTGQVFINLSSSIPAGLSNGNGIFMSYKIISETPDGDFIDINSTILV